MFPDERARNARGLAVGAVLAMGIFALLTLSLGVVMIVRGVHDRNVTIPPSSFGFGGLGSNPGVATLLFMLWLASIAGMWASTIFGVVALARSKAGWVRASLYGITAPTMVVISFWRTQQFEPANPLTRGSRELAEGRDIVVTVVGGGALMVWLLWPVLKRRVTTRSSEASPQTYSDSTT